MIPVKVPFQSTWIISLAAHLPAWLMVCPHTSVKKSLQQNSCQIHLGFMLIPAHRKTLWCSRAPYALCAAPAMSFQVTGMTCPGGWDDAIPWQTDRTAVHKNVAFKMHPSAWKAGEPVIYSTVSLSVSYPRRRLVPLASSSPCQSTRRRNTMWGRDAIAMTGLLLLHSWATSVEREHCLFLVL